MFRKRCASCHDEERTRGDLDLTSLEGVKAGSSSGPVIVPGKPDDSLVYTLAAHREDPKMPPGAPRIPQRELDLIRDWIARGISETELKPAAKPQVVLAKATPANSAEVTVAKGGLEPVKPWQQNAAVTALAVHPKSDLTAVAGLNQVLLYDDLSRPAIGALPFPEGKAFVLKFVRGGDVLLAGGGVGAESGRVVAFDVATRKRLFAIGDETDIVLAADLSPDGSLVAMGGPGRTVKIYRTSNGELLTTLKKHTDWILSLAYSPDGLLLASSDRFGGVQVWEAETGKIFDTLRGHSGQVTAVWWPASSDALATAGDDGTLRVWNMHDGSSKSVTNIGIGPILSATTNASGRVCLGGRQNAIAVLNSSLTLVATLPFNGEAVEVAATDSRVIAASASGGVEVIGLNDQADRSSLQIPVAAAIPSIAKAPIRRSQLQTAAIAVNDTSKSTPAIENAAQSIGLAGDRLAELRHSAALADAAVKATEAALATQRAVSERLNADIRRLEQSNHGSASPTTR
ncbi:c-type cytochrome domain-containing protein [Caulifigura coniformis]|uniref:c-type cytochrome domain-containing protein n=1 Tax=Caulifigura coniformis TaxID=2527983 RepID=UPI0018D23A60|nr:c-type cytochrome domain-containing protein [Caulifigura coniformis]